jgi:hypothetical protein
MKRLLCTLALLAASTFAADQYAVYSGDTMTRGPGACPRSAWKEITEFDFTLNKNVTRKVAVTGIDSARVSDAQRAALGILKVVPPAPYDPATHVPVAVSYAKVGITCVASYTLKTVAEVEAERQAAKSAALKQAEAEYTAVKDPKTLEETIAKLKATIAVLQAGGRLDDKAVATAAGVEAPK